MILGIASGALLAAGGVSMGLAADAGAASKTWEVGAESDSYGYPDALAEYEYQRAVQARNGLLGAGAAALGVGGVGLGFTIVLGTRK